MPRFLPPVDVNITVGLGGTDTERILIFDVKVGGSCAAIQKPPTLCASCHCACTFSTLHCIGYVTASFSTCQGQPASRILTHLLHFHCFFRPFQVITSTSALMVVSGRKGHIVHATAQLGTMLGYSRRQLEAMDLSSLVPPPYGQMLTQPGGFLRAVST